MFTNTGTTNTNKVHVPAYLSKRGGVMCAISTATPAPRLSTTPVQSSNHFGLGLIFQFGCYSSKKAFQSSNEPCPCCFATNFIASSGDRTKSISGLSFNQPHLASFTIPFSSSGMTKIANLFPTSLVPFLAFSVDAIVLSRNVIDNKRFVKRIFGNVFLGAIFRIIEIHEPACI